MESRWLSPKTAAAYLEVKVATVYAWTSDGTIPSVRIFRRHPKGQGRHRCTIRIDKLSLEKMLKSKEG